MAKGLSRRDKALAKSAVVVAHPDDEIIWFSSLLASMSTIFFCYLDSPISKGYRTRRLKLLAEHPLKEKIVCLDASNKTLKTKLAKALKSYRTIFTHNPWGEYGHEQHILVYNIVKRLRDRYKFELWVSEFSPKQLRMPPDADMIQIRELYVQHGIWTLNKNRWAPFENFWLIPE